jgi:hypothetical protein
MRRDMRAHACCPRHNEPFCVLLASPCALYQHVQLLRCSAAPLQLASSFFAAVANVGAQMMMVKQGGSETADNVGSKLVNVAHSRCQRSLPGRSCYPARRRHYPARGSRDDETWFNMRPHQMCRFIPNLVFENSKMVGRADSIMIGGLHEPLGLVQKRQVI